MKTFIMAFSALLLTAICAQAQFEKGDWELGMTITAGSYSETSKSDYYEYEDRATYLAVALIPGYFLIDGLSVEPEFNYYTLQDADATFQLLGNLSYTGWIPGQRAAWFVRAGIGTGNGVPYPGLTFSLWDAEESILVLNFGAGLKVPVSHHAALRTELNYRIYRFTHESSPYEYPSGSTDYDIRDFGFRIGFSILL
ncbi:MAG TPA: outer membrane beta-barrel protein [bacterium]|jgi:hypothetical protein